MSLREAINRKCRECIYDQNDAGTWRKQVENCTSYQCGLYDHRPKPHNKAKTVGKTELIARC